MVFRARPAIVKVESETFVVRDDEIVPLPLKLVEEDSRRNPSAVSEEAAGVPYTDGSGRYADMHSLRHSFITNLAKSGVHPKQAQDLARHSDINLTLTRYSHTIMPDLSSGPDRETARATGTDGLCLQASLQEKPTSARSTLSSIGQVRELEDRKEPNVNPDGMDTYGADCPPVSPHVTKPPVRFERTTCGLQNRCSTN